MRRLLSTAQRRSPSSSDLLSPRLLYSSCTLCTSASHLKRRTLVNFHELRDSANGCVFAQRRWQSSTDGGCSKKYPYESKRAVPTTASAKIAESENDKSDSNANSDTTIKSETTTKPTTSASTDAPPLVDLHNNEKPVFSIRLPRFFFGRVAARIQRRREKRRNKEADGSELNMAEFASFGGMGGGQMGAGMGMMGGASDGMMTSTVPVAIEKQRKENEEREWILLSTEERRQKHEEQRRKRRVKFWRKIALVFVLTPLYLYYKDNGKAKAQAQAAAGRLASSSSKEARKLITLAKMDNSELIGFYFWLLSNATEFAHLRSPTTGALLDDVHLSDFKLSVDDFGEYLAKSAAVMEDRRKAEKSANGESEDEDDNEPITAEELREVMKLKYFSRSKVLEPWDVACLFRQIYATPTTPLPLELLMVAVSQLSREDTVRKSEVAFRIAANDMSSDNPTLDYDSLVHLIDSMVITGHFTTTSLVKRISYWPHAFSAYTPAEMASLIFKLASVQIEADSDHSEDSVRISMQQFKDVLSEMPKKKWYQRINQPWFQAWYVSRMEHINVRDRDAAIEKKKKEKEKALAKLLKEEAKA